jgi:acyl-CoA synthetase (AMP-forming)/AMP-acid ligase II
VSDQTLPQLVQTAAEKFAGNIAIQEQDKRISFKELNALRIQACRAFMAAGVEKGDRVAIWAPNISEWIIAAIGLHSAGAVLVPLNTRMKGSEAAFILNESGAKFLLTVAGFLGIDYPAMLANEAMPSLEKIILLRGATEAKIQQPLEQWSAFIKGADTISEDAAEQRTQALSPSDSMDIMFTSGTTGKPKGVISAHGQNIKSFTTWSNTVGLNATDNYLIINPFFHSFGYKAGWLSAIIQGAKMLPVLTFDLDEVLAQIERDKISMLPGPPTIYQSLLAHPNRGDYDLSSLRLAVTGAAAVPVELVNQMWNDLGFETVVTAYGLTETCGVVTICRPEDSAEIISTTSGRAMPGVDVKCVNSEGASVAIGEAGEICVRGYNVMQGYFNNPQATQEAIDNEGWLHTGDVGVLDEQGYLRITDRLKDMIISGGFNVYPAEIENGLASIAGVVQSAVVGIADERMGEVAKAFIVKQQGSELDVQAVIDWCKANMANYKVPRAVEFIDAMPLNAAGKILKTELRGR